MTTLIIGGTGNSGLKLAHLLHDAGKSVLITSRSGVAPAPFKAVRFDWFDQTTFENPFTADASIDRVYIIGPPALDTLPIVKPFIDLAVSKGVKLFVPLSATMAPPGGHFMGTVHQYLIDIGVNYCSLRPTSFQENFRSFHAAEIRDNNEISSTCKDGRVPFVSTNDIAQAAFNALTDESGSLRSELFVVGPELYTYGEVAELLTEILGRKITYKSLSEPEALQIWTSFGIPEAFASALIAGHTNYSTGSEEKAFNGESKFVGKHRIRDYFQEHRDLWIAKD